MKRTLLIFALLLSAPQAGSGEPSQGRWAILLSGISGDPGLQQEYLKWIKDLYSSLTGPMQFSRDRVYVLFDDPSKDPELIRRRSTRASLEEICREISGNAGKDDLVLIFLAGHGNFDGKTYKLNLPGPDPTAEELAKIFYSIPTQRFIVANMTTCSGGSIPALSRKGAIVISATKSGMEKNQTQMGQFLVQAFKTGNADVDKNGRISVLEAYTYAAQKVEEYYETHGLLKTEHAVLDDDGDGQAQPSPGPENGEGLLARTTFLDDGPNRPAEGGLAPADEALLSEIHSVEKEIEALRYMKAEMPEAEYEKKLEALLLRLARLNAKRPKSKN